MGITENLEGFSVSTYTSLLSEHSIFKKQHNKPSFPENKLKLNIEMETN